MFRKKKDIVTEEPRVFRKTSRSLIICTYLYVSNPSLKSRRLLNFSPLYPSWNPYRAVVLELTNRWTSGWISPLELHSWKAIRDNMVKFWDKPATELLKNDKRNSSIGQTDCAANETEQENANNTNCCSFFKPMLMIL